MNKPSGILRTNKDFKVGQYYRSTYRYGAGSIVRLIRITKQPKDLAKDMISVKVLHSSVDYFGTNSHFPIESYLWELLSYEESVHWMLAN